MLQELLDFLEAEMDAKGLDALMPRAHVANYARPRRFEVQYWYSCYVCDHTYIHDDVLITSVVHTSINDCTINK